MSDPLPSNPHPDSVPPLSDRASEVERESADHASKRARDSERISSASCDEVCATTRACEAVDRFVREHPLVSVGLALGLGLAVGASLRLNNH
ncbi:glycine zipper domain-containing protein [Luteolibacter soli]|uniref:glycine zipper domain-containing protein n=1 Tax=Luteolibacter soli TaxID=3135280 RepID=UPI0035C91A44